MKVIRHGNTEREIECKNCKALLSYCDNDIKYNFELDDYSFCGRVSSWSEAYIVCPECRKKIVLSLMIDGEEKIK